MSDKPKVTRQPPINRAYPTRIIGASKRAARSGDRTAMTSTAGTSGGASITGSTIKGSPMIRYIKQSDKPDCDGDLIFADLKYQPANDYPPLRR